MSQEWTDRIQKGRIDDANLALSAYFITKSEKEALAELYGVGLRTVERWFVGTGQRRNCIPYEVIGKRLCFMNEEARLFYLRLRCVLPFCLAFEGIVRTPPFTGEERFTVEPAPLLADAIGIADSVIGGEWHDFLAQAWSRVYIAQLPATDTKGNDWNVVIYYKLYLPGERYNTEDLPELEEGEEYAEDDESSNANFVWEPA